MKPLSRRVVLRGGGLALALPWLEAKAQAPAPKRLVVFNTPNGFYRPAMVSSPPGQPLQLAPTLRALEPLKSDILVLSGIDNHDRGAAEDAHAPHASLFTGGRTFENKRVIRPSYDQFLASRLKRLGLRRKSLELSTRRTLNGPPSKHFFSWRSPTDYVVTGSNPDPLALYLDLFGASDAAMQARARQALLHRQALIDFVLPHSRTLASRLGSEDKRRLGAYLESVAEVQRQLALPQPSCGRGGEGAFAYAAADGLSRQIDLITDLIVLAIQCDVTRLVTYQTDIETVRAKYGFVTVPEFFLRNHTGAERIALTPQQRTRIAMVLGTHEYHNGLSHYTQGTTDGEAANSQATETERVWALRAIEEWLVGKYARLVQKMKSLPGENGGSLLDSAMVVFTGSLAHGNSHETRDLPVVIAGRGGGIIRPGRHLRLSKGTAGFPGGSEPYGRRGLPASVYTAPKIESLWVTLGDALGVDQGPTATTDDLEDDSQFWATRPRLSLA